jgi:hypothetical protein
VSPLFRTPGGNDTGYLPEHISIPISAVKVGVGINILYVCLMFARFELFSPKTAILCHFSALKNLSVFGIIAIFAKF